MTSTNPSSCNRANPSWCNSCFNPKCQVKIVSEHLKHETSDSLFALICPLVGSKILCHCAKLLTADCGYLHFNNHASASAFFHEHRQSGFVAGLVTYSIRPSSSSVVYSQNGIKGFLICPTDASDPDQDAPVESTDAHDVNQDVAEDTIDVPDPEHDDIESNSHIADAGAASDRVPLSPPPTPAPKWKRMLDDTLCEIETTIKHKKLRMAALAMAQQTLALEVADLESALENVKKTIPE